MPSFKQEAATDLEAEEKLTPVEELFERIRDTVYAIPLTGISVLTGKNGSGKSFVRKQLTFRVKDELKTRLIHSSQELRSASNPGLGALSGFAHDLPWLSTSHCTWHILNQIPVKDNFVVIDEPEIGCSEETVMALVDWFNSWMPTCGAKGFLFITHSRYTIQHLHFDHFFNLDGYQTKEEWLNRPLIPTNLQELAESPLFFYIRDLEKELSAKKRQKK